MPTKKNFLGAQQNYNPKNGEYEPALVGKNGKPIEDADGDGKKHEDKTGDYYKIKHPEITNTDAYLTAPIIKTLEKAEGRELSNDELRQIVKDMASKNPNVKPEDFEKMLLNYQKEDTNKFSKFGKEKSFTGDKFLSEEHLDSLFEKFGGDENKVLDALRADPEYQKSEITNSDLQGIVEVHTMKKSFDSINKKRMGV